jgi:hypothetical protein
MNPRNLNENYATYENNADAWWHQLDLDKERQAEELKAIYDRAQLDHQQAQQHNQETDHDRQPR